MTLLHGRGGARHDCRYARLSSDRTSLDAGCVRFAEQSQGEATGMTFEMLCLGLLLCMFLLVGVGILSPGSPRRHR